MATTTIQSDSIAVTRQQVATEVYTKQRWSDAWTLQANLICNSVQFRLNGMGRAEFLHYFGRISDRDTGAFSDVEMLDLKNHWVRVDWRTEANPETTPPATDYEEYTQKEHWYGFITHETVIHGGSSSGAPTGNQVYMAHSLEYFLTRWSMTETKLWDGTTMHTIGRGLSFNGFKSDRRTGAMYQERNKYLLTVDGGKYAFQWDLTDDANTEQWLSTDIVKYLVQEAWSTNQFELSTDVPPLSVDVDVSIYEPLEVTTHGRTAYEIINEVLNHNRALAWRITSSATDNAGTPVEAFTLEAVSTSPIQLAFANGGLIEESVENLIIDITNSQDVISATSTMDHTQRYFQVCVTGGRQGAVFTLAYADSTLEANWTTALRTEYEEAATNATSYATLDLSEKATFNDRVRMSDRFRTVFTSHRVPLDWDGRSGDGAGGAKNVVFPALTTWSINPSGPRSSENVWPHGVKMMPFLPLKVGHDYSGGGETPINDNPSGTLADYQAPLVVANVLKFYDASSVSSWAVIDSTRVSDVFDELRAYGMSQLSCSVRVHENGLGVDVIPNGVPHVMQTDDYYIESLTAIGQSHVEFGETHYETICATVYAQNDNLIRIYHPELTDPADAPDIDYSLAGTNAVMTIQLGDRARFDYLAPNTILDINPTSVSTDQRVRIPNGVALRDDRAKMKELAQLAFQWYKQERRSIEITWAQVLGGIYVGMLVRELQFGAVSPPAIELEAQDNAELTFQNGADWITLGVSGVGQEVNTVVSDLVIDFQRGSTMIRTDFAELDLAGLF